MKLSKLLKMNGLIYCTAEHKECKMCKFEVICA